jgi:alpha-galactosidase
MAEWTVFLKNSGHEDTPILENLQALDARFERSPEGEFTLHGSKGDWCVPQSYEPYHHILGPNSRDSFAPDCGRPTNGPRGWPYFNLQMHGGGLIFAIGWPGQWACRSSGTIRAACARSRVSK